MVKDAEKILSITCKTMKDQSRKSTALSKNNGTTAPCSQRGMQRNYRIWRHRPLFTCQNFEYLDGLDQVSLKLVLYL